MIWISQLGHQTVSCISMLSKYSNSYIRKKISFLSFTYYIKRKKIRVELLFLFIHCVSKTFPPLNSLQRCQILTDFQIFAPLKAYEIYYKNSTTSPTSPYRHVATLPWEIKNSNCRYSEIWKKMQRIVF